MNYDNSRLPNYWKYEKSMDLSLILNYVPRFWNEDHVKNVKYQINRPYSNRFFASKGKENTWKSNKNDQIELRIENMV